MQMVRAQNRTIELDGLLAEFGEQEKKTNAELNKKNGDVVRLKAEVAELRKNEALAKKRPSRISIPQMIFRRQWSPWLVNTLARASTSARGSLFTITPTSASIWTNNIHNGDQDALSFCNEWTFLIMVISTMVIKTHYHFAMNRHS